MPEKIYNLNLENFARLWGIKPADIPEKSVSIIKKNDFRYMKLPAIEATALLNRIETDINNNEFLAAGKNAHAYWEEKWAAQLKGFAAKKYEVKALVPAYFNKPIRRFNGDFIVAVDHDFEINWSRAYKYWLFQKYLKDCDNVFEFGCGSGMNLAVLAELFPKKRLFCSDWAAASVKIADVLAEKHSWNLSSFVFDMFQPDYGLVVPENSAFLTFSALEQLGRNYRDFIEFAIQKKIDIFVTVDSIEELYDKTAYDNLARKFIRKRNYLKNYLTFLRNLEGKGKIKIIKAQRVRFGNLYHDGYSYIVWKPTKG